MPNLYVEEEHVSYDDNGRSYGLGDSGVYESFAETPGELFRHAQQEHGRCVSKVYVDTSSDGGPKAIGWVFQKRREYQDDPRRTYIHEVWVTIHDAPPTVTREHHYHEL